MTALEDNATLTAKHLDSPAFSNLVTFDGAIDAPLPDVGDDLLVRDLLTTTTFVGSYGTAWKTAGGGGLRAFGPTGPFQPSLIDASGNENRSVRAGLTGIVKPYDAATHPSSRYSFYRPTP